MKILTITKAEPIGDQEINSVEILIGGKTPHLETLENMRTYYARQAQELFQALSGSLPGGTLDQLAALLLMHKASSLIIPEPPNPEHIRRAIINCQQKVQDGRT